MFPREIQKIISTYMIWGFLPLDKVLHFVVGAIITIILRSLKMRMKKVLIILFLIELTKEIIDFFTLNNSLVEDMMDFIVTFIYPLLLLVVIKIKEILAIRIAHEEMIELEKKKNESTRK